MHERMQYWCKLGNIWIRSSSFESLSASGIGDKFNHDVFANLESQLGPAIDAAVHRSTVNVSGMLHLVFAFLQTTVI